MRVLTGAVLVPAEHQQRPERREVGPVFCRLFVPVFIRDRLGLDWSHDYFVLASFALELALARRVDARDPIGDDRGLAKDVPHHGVRPADEDEARPSLSLRSAVS